MKQHIARAIGALAMGTVVLAFVGAFIGWHWAFIGMAALAPWELVRLSMEATDAP